MATGKKSFVLYVDQHEIFNSLITSDQKVELMDAIFLYVKDKAPIVKDPLVNMAFNLIKLQLKRDLEKWDNTLLGKSRAGKASAKARELKRQQTLTNPTRVESVEQDQRNQRSSTVNVNDNVTVSVNDNVNDTVNEIKTNRDRSEIEISSPAKENDQIVKSFKKWSLEEFKENILENKKDYTDDLLAEFGTYWSECDDKGKMRFQLNKTWSTLGRLATWKRNNEKFGVKKKNGIGTAKEMIDVFMSFDNS